MKTVVLSVLVGLATALTPEGARAETLFRVAELAAYDSTGKRVGAVSAYHANRTGEWEGSTVALRVGASLLFVRVFPASLKPHDVRVYFPTTDCSGQAYMGTDPLSPLATIGGPRQTVYVRGGPTVAQPLTIRSSFTDDGQCQRRDGYQVPSRTPARKTDIDLADRFAPPFTLRATPGAQLLPGATA